MIAGHYNWSKVYNVCDANTHDRQSPIDIIEKDALFDHTLTTIFFEVFGPENDTITIINNGHTGQFVGLTVGLVSGMGFVLLES